MHIYKTTEGIFIENEQKFYWLAGDDFDELINRDNLFSSLQNEIATLPPTNLPSAEKIVAPLQNQEIWAAGVTYLRSRDARKEESKDSGGGSFYDKVYDAERPELFFKSTPCRCVGPNQKVRIRKDSTWNVPEPELTLVINRHAKIVGYTVGNDMSSRSIEGENPLYLPQAKSYDGSAAIGPCIYVPDTVIDPSAQISMTIKRNQAVMYADNVAISQMKRTHTELIEFLFREMSFPKGCFLMTGTCLVPPNDFTLQSGDEIIISIDHIGSLQNFVE